MNCISNNIYFGSIHTRDTYTLPNGLVRKVPQTSNFFRFENYYNVIESIGKYFSANTTNNPIDILSIGCGYGEEVYSLAMAMDYYNIPCEIEGFDNSQMMLDEIEDGQYRLSDYELKYLKPNNCHFEDKITPSEFQIAMRNAFTKNFELTDKWCSTYKPKQDMFHNCKFYRNDAKKLENIHQNNSKDLIMCSYVMDELKENEQKELIKQIYKTLKPSGILCISPYEVYDLKSQLELEGFNQLSENTPWLFQKPNLDYKIYHY